LGLFGKKKPDRDEIIAQGIAEADAMADSQEKKEDTFSSGNAKLDIEITKIKAQLESLNEVRKANSERFSRVSEQMGELRGMIMDTNKTMSKIEVSATKAIDLVESVQPEKLMIEIRKQEGKGEALKANIESNEVMMKDIMDDLKKIRQQMSFYKGIEQVAKLNEEVKGEIMEIKKVEAIIERHADKAETIFLDLEKKFAEFDKFEKTVDDIDKNFHAIQGDFDNMKLQLTNKAEKKELGSVMDKFTEFEKHTGAVMKLLDERSKHMKLELKDAINKVKDIMRRKQGIIMDQSAMQMQIPAQMTMTDQAAQPMAQTAAQPASYISPMDGIAKGPPPPGTQVVEAKDGVKKDEAIKRDARLRDILKKRRIVSHTLSDEEEAPTPEQASQGQQGQATGQGPQEPPI